MIEFAIFFIFICVFISLVYDNARVRLSRLRLTEKLLQITIDNNILKDDISIKNSQEYLNFLNKSREDAYVYIETVHESFAKFEDRVGPIIKHFDSVGAAASGYPLYDQMLSISNSYKELKNVFPNNTNND